MELPDAWVEVCLGGALWVSAHGIVAVNAGEGKLFPPAEGIVWTLGAKFEPGSLDVVVSRSAK